MPTTISRSELHELLRTVEPALGTANQVVPQFVMLWFDGKTVTTYNDDIGMSVDCSMGLEGGIDGKSLIAVLSNSTAKQVEITPDKEHVNLRLAGAKVKLPLSESQYAAWHMPDQGNSILSVEPAQLIAAIKHCMRSVGSSPSMPESLGVTFEVSKKRLTLYSTNDTAVSRATVDMKGTVGFERVTVHKAFCEQLLALASKKVSKFRLELTNDHALLHADKVRLWGRLLSSHRPIDFEEQIEQLTTGIKQDDATPIPPNLQTMLERSLIFCTDHPRITLTVASESSTRLTIHSESERGRMHDSVKFEGHPQIEVDVDPRDLKGGCDLDTIAITDGAVVMHKGSDLYVVSTLAAVKRKR